MYSGLAVYSTVSLLTDEGLTLEMSANKLFTAFNIYPHQPCIDTFFILQLVSLFVLNIFLMLISTILKTIMLATETQLLIKLSNYSYNVYIWLFRGRFST